MKKRITIIGSGLAGMACAAYLAKEGHEVQVIEKNRTYGGRLQTYEENGFVFDSGPSWYWMPDIFDSFFADFGKSTSDFYDLKRINPGYRVYFGDDETFDLEEDLVLLKNLLSFEFKYFGIESSVTLPPKPIVLPVELNIGKVTLFLKKG